MKKKERRRRVKKMEGKKNRNVDQEEQAEKNKRTVKVSKKN